MFRFWQLAVTVVAAGAIAGCASSMNVSSHVERGLDFSRYQSYDWGPADALPTGDPRLDKDPFFKDHVQGAVEKALATRGLSLAASGSPDLLIHYHANVTQRINVSGADRQYACPGPDCGAVNEYEAGTLVIDLVDARTNRIIWRGWAQDRLEPLLNDQDRMERHINDAVARMFRQLPPTLAR